MVTPQLHSSVRSMSGTRSTQKRILHHRCLEHEEGFYVHLAWQEL